MTAGDTGAPGDPPATGLRRFVKRPAAPPGRGPGGPNGPAPDDPLAIARAVVGARPRREDDGREHCELCQEVLDDRHGHLVDVENRSLACACRACYLLFTQENASRYRAVPDRVRCDPARPLTDADWGELEIPVAMAFFFYNSVLDRVVAGYPSPGGVTECELDLAAWDRLTAAYPLLADLAPDTEAIFVNRADDEVFLIPIDACYSLVGELRMRWTGFDGGTEVRESIAAFLAGLRQRARPLEATASSPGPTGRGI